MPSLKAGYVDPQPIAQTNFDCPRKWKLDCKELSAGKTVAEKEAIRNGVIRKESLRVAAYLAYLLCISNKTMSYEYHTTSSKLDSILKAYSIYLCSMQNILSV
jgi:hypothetical protein